MEDDKILQVLADISERLEKLEARRWQVPEWVYLPFTLFYTYFWQIAVCILLVIVLWGQFSKGGVLPNITPPPAPTPYETLPPVIKVEPTPAITVETTPAIVSDCESGTCAPTTTYQRRWRLFR